METNRFQWKIGGEAGFGIMTTGLVFSRVCMRAGLKTFAYPEYPSLIRGGHNTYQVFVDAEQASTQIHPVHILVALNKETITLHTEELIDGSAIIYDPADFKDGLPTIEGKQLIWVPVPMNQIIKEREGHRVARNTIAIGASLGLLQCPWEIIEGVISDWFGKKKPHLAEENVALTKIGYDAVAGKYATFNYNIEARTPAKPHMVISGNGSIAMGAMKAGMKFFAAYPMTPSSDILGYLSRQERKMDLVVKHTEDEIAAMNMIIGAGFAGVRAMTATSGGGFALMGEALGMAGLAEVPIVVIMGQRPGPSTGLPTWTSQADLRFVLHASQGEFPRIVLTPGDAEECFQSTYEAFNLAEKYQTPVIVVVDKYVQESWKSVELYEATTSIDRGKLLTQDELNAAVENGAAYLRHKYTQDGVSPRALPGMEHGRHIASSYEHVESGATTEDELETVKQNDKRFEKLQTFLKTDAKGPVFYGPENADLTIVGWGSTKQPALEAVRMAEAAGLSINYLHFIYIDPLPLKLVQEALRKTKKTLCVEGNKLGQLEGWVREHAGITMSDHFRKYGGRPFYPEEILEQAKKHL
ncbi:MAG: 2-oxoacid:acceptor oxidoreductase subunit alpha [Candidatus Kerfeldbacteria bacterium]|nr:2-oxoacid:acceptor oxidoreductase subunit alpha [Candidatus Kerfeldbacteria bacterium]